MSPSPKSRPYKSSFSILGIVKDYPCPLAAESMPLGSSGCEDGQEQQYEVLGSFPHNIRLIKI